jgi:hypothetical protein
MGMVSAWTMFFQRSDVNLRNEWSNYTNWPYGYLPYDIMPAPTDDDWRCVNNVLNENVSTTTSDILTTSWLDEHPNDQYYYDKNGPKNGIGPGILVINGLLAFI